MKSFLLALLVSAPVLTQAKFYLPDDLPTKPLRLSNIVKSVNYIRSDLSNDKCSGFFVSEEGHYVTALHCIEACLRKNFLFKNSNPSNQWDHPGPVSQNQFHKVYNTLQGKPNQRVFCKDELLTFPEDWEMYSNPELLAIGRGWATVSSEGIDQLTEEQYDAVRNGIDDFAILKFPVRRKTSCLKISLKTQKDANVWAFGFPVDTNRDEGFNSNGRSRYSSTGHVRGSIGEDDYLKTLPMSDLAWKRQLELTGDSKYLLTTSDVVSSMSGGVYVDDQGDAQAIIYSSNARDSLSKPFWGTSFGMRLDYVQKRVKEITGTDVFSCKSQSE